MGTTVCMTKIFLILLSGTLVTLISGILSIEIKFGRAFAYAAYGDVTDPKEDAKITEKEKTIYPPSTVPTAETVAAKPLRYMFGLIAHAYHNIGKQIPNPFSNKTATFLVLDTDLGAAYLTQEKTVLVCGIRGTSTFKDMVLDLNLQQEHIANPVKILRNKRTFLKKIRLTSTNDDPKSLPGVHQGFYKVAQNDVVKPISELLKSNPVKTLYVAGHSMGASISLISAYLLAIKFPPIQVNVHMLGPPRTGNSEFMQNVHECTNLTVTWYVNTSDAIPTMPPAVCPNYLCPKQPIYYSHPLVVPKLINVSSKTLEKNHSFFTYISNIKNVF